MKTDQQLADDLVDAWGYLYSSDSGMGDKLIRAIRIEAGDTRFDTIYELASKHWQAITGQGD
jgi:hypothetical protein